MGIGYRIKEARERLGLTQTELGTMIGVTGSAITNYEKENSHPKEQIIYKLMETLNVDANYLFQDAVKIKSTENSISLLEHEIIKKYRELDTHGKEMVDFTLEKEYDRSIDEKKKSSNITPMTVEEPSYYKINAAHADDYMSAPDELKEAEEKMLDEDF